MKIRKTHELKRLVQVA